MRCGRRVAHRGGIGGAHGAEEALHVLHEGTQRGDGDEAYEGQREVLAEELHGRGGWFNFAASVCHSYYYFD